MKTLQPIKLIFIVAAYNEERRIAATIESIQKFAHQIIIIDPGSTDSTNSIAMNIFPVTICKTNLAMFDVVGRFDEVVQFINTEISNPWIFPMNCSERFTDSLGAQILEIINSNANIFGIRLYRQSYTMNTRTHERRLYHIAVSYTHLTLPTNREV